MRMTSGRSLKSCSAPAEYTGGDFHWIQSHSPLYRGPGPTSFLLQLPKKAVKSLYRSDSNRCMSPEGHHPLRSGNGEASLLYGHQLRRAFYRDLRYRWTCHSHGAFALVRFVVEEVVKPCGQQIRVDWHGHVTAAGYCQLHGLR